MNQIKLNAIVNVITHLKNAVTAPHSIAAIIVVYIAVVVFTLKVFHFMKDRNGN
ncbi:MAG: hypothetical protein ABJA79_09210 [Parafilimonas sp.]